MKRGLLISIEGGDGSGKSTQIALLKSGLEGLKLDVALTREPGGTRISEAIRGIILDRTYMEMSDVTEALLYAAARAQHVAEYIEPRLEEGVTVITDRFVDSSIVYQGYARGLGFDMVSAINSYATGGLTPDLTIYLHVPAMTGLKRKTEERVLDRLELAKDEFHHKVESGFEMLAAKEKDRILKVDATRSIVSVQETVWERVFELLMQKGFIGDSNTALGGVS